ncbi:MAG: hypothetical protein K0Q49_659 [Haloplasmataceae bacterium]|jgi:hypothetical protein|nr:hypothetical protein [Haloplasmataceae bacterium]
MNNRNQEIAISLLKMLEYDFKVRDDLANKGELYQGYHPVMESVHNQNAEYLEKIIYEIGWPTNELVGEEAAYAAWLILGHAISKPKLIKKTLLLLEEQVKQNKISPKDVAMLYDKICFFEMRPQKYGTQFDYNENNELVPWKIEDVEKVDQLRKQVGLPPLVYAIQFMQKQVKDRDQQFFRPYKERQKERKKWAKKMGWIK